MSENQAIQPPPKLALSESKKQHTHNYYPSFGQPLVVEVVADGAGLPRGTRGHIRCGYGTSLYNFHRELPVNGMGIAHNAVAVVEIDSDGKECVTAYLDWCRQHSLKVRCLGCRENILDTAGQECPARVASRRRRFLEQQADQKLEMLRKHFASSPENPTPPLKPAPSKGARQLRTGMGDLEQAREAARQYAYDYDGVHIVGRVGDKYFDVYACGFRNVPGAGADSASLTQERDWPIPMLG